MCRLGTRCWRCMSSAENWGTHVGCSRRWSDEIWAHGIP
uniref:Uncharacterized protein n=1 Tax=Arundo donax TaxID=35708 RepID=A0A0A9F863_ARUDO